MDSDELRQRIESHRRWLAREGGEQANLSYADLSEQDLRGADLRYANLLGADLRSATLINACLRGATLRGADLRYSDLSYSDLSYSDLQFADFRYSDLSNAGLSEASLSDADLRSAVLSDITGNMRHIKSLNLETWGVAYTSEIIQIGCQQYPIEKWWSFDDETIAAMDEDGRALEWWRKWKRILQQIIHASPAEPTKEDS